MQGPKPSLPAACVASRSLAVACAWICFLAALESTLAHEFDADDSDSPSQEVLQREQVVDSSSLEAVNAPAATATDDLFAPSSRAYVAPIIGPSWSTLSRSLEDVRLSSSNGNLFTAGGAIGCTIPSEFGQFRVELESRYRDSYTVRKTTEVGVSGFRVGDNWSVLANTWLDFQVTKDFGMYAGGGLGGGGYSMTAAGISYGGDFVVTGQSKVATFAWQAGGGVIYALNDRVHFDVGYRFYNVADGTLPLTFFGDNLPLGTGNLTTSFTASELLFSLRIYDPLSPSKR